MGEMNEIRQTARDVPFDIGASVTHHDWREGVARRYDGDQVVVLFESVGYETLSLELVRDRGPLEASP